MSALEFEDGAISSFGIPFPLAPGMPPEGRPSGTEFKAISEVMKNSTSIRMMMEEFRERGFRVLESDQEVRQYPGGAYQDWVICNHASSLLMITVVSREPQQRQSGR